MSFWGQYHAAASSGDDNCADPSQQEFTDSQQEPNSGQAGYARHSPAFSAVRQNAVGGTQPSKKNYSPEEDKVLVEAWLETSEDPIIGTDQSLGEMWARIVEYYYRYIGANAFYRDRRSLCNRYVAINRDVNKFIGCLRQVENQRISGNSEQDDIAQALSNYRDEQKSEFKLLHCWKLMKGHPKWLAAQAVKRPRSNKDKGKAKASGSGATQYGDITDLTEEPETLVGDIPRPIGQKKAKSQAKRATKGSVMSDSQLEEVLCRMVAKSDSENSVKLQESEDYNRELCERQVRLQESREMTAKYLAEQKQDEVDFEYVCMNIENEVGAKREYLEIRQAKAIARLKGRNFGFGL